MANMVSCRFQGTWSLDRKAIKLTGEKAASFSQVDQDTKSVLSLLGPEIEAMPKGFHLSYEPSSDLKSPTGDMIQMTLPSDQNIAQGILSSVMLSTNRGGRFSGWKFWAPESKQAFIQRALSIAKRVLKA